MVLAIIRNIMLIIFLLPSMAAGETGCGGVGRPTYKIGETCCFGSGPPGKCYPNGWECCGKSNFDGEHMTPNVACPPDKRCCTDGLTKSICCRFDEKCCLGTTPTCCAPDDNNCIKKHCDTQPTPQYEK